MAGGAEPGREGQRWGQCGPGQAMEGHLCWPRQGVGFLNLFSMCDRKQ